MLSAKRTDSTRFARGVSQIYAQPRALLNDLHEGVLQIALNFEKEYGGLEWTLPGGEILRTGFGLEVESECAECGPLEQLRMPKFAILQNGDGVYMDTESGLVIERTSSLLGFAVTASSPSMWLRKRFCEAEYRLQGFAPNRLIFAMAPMCAIALVGLGILTAEADSNDASSFFAFGEGLSGFISPIENEGRFQLITSDLRRALDLLRALNPLCGELELVNLPYPMCGEAPAELTQQLSTGRVCRRFSGFRGNELYLVSLDNGELVLAQQLCQHTDSDVIVSSGGPFHTKDELAFG